MRRVRFEWRWRTVSRWTSLRRVTGCSVRNYVVGETVLRHLSSSGHIPGLMQANEFTTKIGKMVCLLLHLLNGAPKSGRVSSHSRGPLRPTLSFAGSPSSLSSTNYSDARSQKPRSAATEEVRVYTVIIFRMRLLYRVVTRGVSKAVLSRVALYHCS